MPGSPVRAPLPSSTNISVFSETMSMLAPSVATVEAPATHTTTSASSNATTFHRLSSYVKSDYDALPSPPPPKKQRCLPEMDMQTAAVTTTTTSFEPLPSAAGPVGTATPLGTVQASGASCEPHPFHPVEKTTGNHAIEEENAKENGSSQIEISSHFNPMPEFESSGISEQRHKGELSPTMPIVTKTTDNSSPLLKTGEKFGQLNSSDHLAQLFSAIQSHQQALRGTPIVPSPSESPAAAVGTVSTSSLSPEALWGRSRKPTSDDSDNAGNDSTKSPSANNLPSPLLNEKSDASPPKGTGFMNWISTAPASSTTISNCPPHLASNHSQGQKRPLTPPPTAVGSPPPQLQHTNEAFTNGSGLPLGASALAAAAMAMSPLFQQGAYGSMDSAAFLRAGAGVFPPRSVNGTWNPVLAAAAAAAAFASSRFHPPPPPPPPPPAPDSSSSSKSIESDGDNVGEGGLLEERGAGGGAMSAEAALGEALSARLLNDSFAATAAAAAAGGANLSVYESLHGRPKSSGDNGSSKSVSPLPLSCAASSTEGVDGAESSGHHWTFQEQFKQLYELNADPKRKEFLDELFSFMQKRGSPVNRIPIMAKQVLDLYELYRLVVTRGGLVEVINKKLWREITKGLQLPSSITSAAFTLRTQYMKYLYPYECEKLGLSTPSELQAAIDGNRREARRSSYSFEYPMLMAGRGGGAAAGAASSGGNQPNAPSSSTCSSLLASSGGSPLSMNCLPSCAAAQSMSTSSTGGLLPPPPLGSSPSQLVGLHSHFLQPGGYNVPSHLLPPGMLHSVAALSSGLLPPSGLLSPLSAAGGGGGHRNPGMPPPPPPPPGLNGLFPSLHHSGFESATHNQSNLLPSGYHNANGSGGSGVVASAAAAAVAASMFGFAAPMFSSPSLDTAGAADFNLPQFTSASAAKSFPQPSGKDGHGLPGLGEPPHEASNSIKFPPREVSKEDKRSSPNKSDGQFFVPSSSGPSDVRSGRAGGKFTPGADFTSAPSTSTEDVDYDAEMPGSRRSRPSKSTVGRNNDLQDGGNWHERPSPNDSTMSDNVDVNAKFLELFKHRHADSKGCEFNHTMTSMGDRSDISFTAIQNAYRQFAKNASERRVLGDKSPDTRSMEERLMCGMGGFQKSPKDMVSTGREGESDCTKSPTNLHPHKQLENASATCSEPSSEPTETTGLPRLETDKLDCNRDADTSYIVRRNPQESPLTTMQLSPEIRISTQSGKQLGLPGNTLVVCMEVNGIIYQGVLFGQTRSS